MNKRKRKRNMGRGKVICLIMSIVMVVGFGMGANVFAMDSGSAPQQEATNVENSTGGGY